MGIYKGVSNENPPPVTAPTPVTYVVDTRTDRLGQVMDRHAGHLQLRPPQGGLEWDCPPECARPASEMEVRRTRAATRTPERKTESRWGL